MKIRLDEKEGMDAGKAIEVEASGHKPSDRVAITVWNGSVHTSIELTAERAQQVAMALLAAFSEGGDAG